MAKAIAKKVISLRIHNLRDYTNDKHQKVDDKPYGGGPGMLLKVQPIYKALQSIAPKHPKLNSLRTTNSALRTRIVMLDPAGKPFDQKMAQKFAKLDRIVFLCGRYEGFDERVSAFVDERVSVGPYVVNGGEVPAMVIMEAVGRLIPGFIGKAESLTEETFSSAASFSSKTTKDKQATDDKPTASPQNFPVARPQSLVPSYKEYPHYTRPDVFEYKKKGKTMRLKVPKVLTEGNHAKIKEWRQKKAS